MIQLVSPEPPFGAAFVKKSLSLLLLIATPAIFAAPMQSTSPAEPSAQTGDNNRRPQSNQATSHDRHMRKHRAGSHHKRHHTTSKTGRP
jgi:Ni/Co efflux regulator RcnB